MTALAQLGDGPVRRSDIVAALGLTSTQVSKQRDSLLKQGLIRSLDYGFPEFTISGHDELPRIWSDAGPRPPRGVWGFTRPGSEVPAQVT